jgi:PAS domain S-box-containing protein
MSENEVHGDEVLRESEALYRGLFENNHAVMLLINPADGAIIDANPASCAYYGWSRAELQQKKIDEINTLNRAEVIAQMTLARAEKRSHFFFKHRRAGGDIRDVEVYSGPLTLKGRTLLYSIVHDITERKRAEEALRQSEEKFRLAFQTSPDAINLNRLADGMYVDVNEGFTKLTGYTRAEAVGKTSLELNIWDNPRDRERLVAGLLREGGVENLEATFRRKNGQTGVGLMSARVLRLNQEDIILSITRDITERKQVEEKLKEAENKYRGLAESLPQVIFEVDADGNLAYINQNAYQLFGYAPRELAREFNVLEAFVPEDRERVALDIRRHAQGELLGRQEYTALKKDGTRFPAAVHANRALREKAAAGVRGILIDLTPIKLAEEERKNLQLQLQQAQKMEAIGALAGGIAHDFNNILSAIIGYTELAILNDDPRSCVADLNESLRAANRARDLVKQILAFSRQTDEERTPVKVGMVVKEAAKFLRATIPSSIEMRVRIDEQAGAVLANAVELHQIVMNLCTNAVHAIGDPGGVLEVAVQNVQIGQEPKNDFIELDPGPYVLVSVTDSGQGMEPDVIDRIFDPYFTTKDKGVGTGLGLAVVHGIVKKSGGAIKVASRPGQGASFLVYLPRADKASPPIKSEPPIPIVGGSERILFVDDEKMLIDIGEKMLERLGYGVVSRTSPIEALELFRAKPDHFDLVITDQTMPGMTGDVFAKELMQIRPDIPVIICTGYSQMIDPERARRKGIKAFVMKPVLVNDIAAAIRRVLGRA